MNKNLLCIALLATATASPVSIMLDPASGSQNNITFQFAHALKSVLEQMGSGIRVVLSRVPNEVVTPLQNANFANRLQVDLFVNIHCYEETTPRPVMFLYYLQYHPVTDRWAKHEQLAFYPYDQAHLANMHRTITIAESVKQSLAHAKAGDCRGPFGIPFKPLVGIKVPAFALEIGCKNNDWQALVHPIALAIAGCFV